MLAAVSMGVFLSTIDGSIVNIALPFLVEEFDRPLSLVQWVVIAYLLTWATLSVSMGRLGDMIGKKKIYILGFGVFTVSSVAVGLAPTIGSLIALRAVQAIGAAMVLSLGVAILTEAFPPEERGKALGFIGAAVSIGIVTGPAAGGFILSSLSWRWIFFVNLPVGIIGTWLAMRNVPDTPPPGGQRFDFAGAALMLIGLLAILVSLSLGQEAGFTSPPLVALFLVGVAALVGFVMVERRVEDPMIDLSMFNNADFTIGLITGFATFLAIRGLVVPGPFFMTDTLGFDARQVGFALAASPIVLGIVAPLSGRLSDRIGTRPVTVVGLAVLAVGYLIMQTIGTETTVWGITLAFVPIGIGMGIFQSPNNSAIMGSVGREHLGVAGAMLGLNRLAGQLIGFAVLVTFWATQVERERVGVSMAESEAIAFRQTNLLGFAIVMVALVISVWALLQDRRTTQPSAR